MASHDLSWAPGMHVRFGDLDFIVTMEGGLAMAHVAIRPLHSTGLDTIAEALEELQMHAPEARAPRSNQLLDFDYGRLERQLVAFLGPQPSQEDLRHLTFSFANIMTQLDGGESLSLEYLIRSTRQRSHPVSATHRDYWTPCGIMHASIPHEQ